MDKNDNKNILIIQFKKIELYFLYFIISYYMSIMSSLENFMVGKSEYYMIENDENIRRYRRKWMELEEVSFKQIFNGECLEVTVPIAGVQYYSRFRLNNDSEEKILDFLDNKFQ
jgi:hypothetical protein